MKLNIYSIYDTASGAYMRPFFGQSDGQAVRSFSDICQDADHEIGKHPEDYSLHRIGIFDDATSKITPESPDCMATALELIAQSRNVNRDNLELFDKKLPTAEEFRKDNPEHFPVAQLHENIKKGNDA